MGRMDSELRLSTRGHPPPNDSLFPLVYPPVPCPAFLAPLSLACHRLLIVWCGVM